MKITCILGSPRPKSNSTQLAERFVDLATDLGSDVKNYNLNQMKYKGCQGCDTCKTKLDRCVLKDDLTEVLDRVRETDILVLSTPVYFMDVTSQLKAFIDRTYSFVERDYLTNPNASRLERGKKLVFIQTQEGGKGSFEDIFARYSLFFQFYGFDECVFIQACGIGQSGDMTEQTEVFQKVEETAKRLCAG